MGRLGRCVAAGVAAFVLVGCSLPGAGSLLPGGASLEVTGGPITEAGVVVQIEHAAATFRDEPAGYDYTFDVTIENTSDEPVMAVSCVITTTGTDGEEVRSFEYVHDEEVRAIAPGEKVTDHIESRWGPAEPASVSLSDVTVTTEAELPALSLPQQGTPLYQALGDDHLANIRTEPPVELVFHIDHGGAGQTATFTSGDELDQAVALLCDIRIGEETDEFVTDNYNYIALNWADGTSTFLSLNLYNLEYAGHSNRWHSYHLENLDPFWDFAETYATADGYDYYVEEGTYNDA